MSEEEFDALRQQLTVAWKQAEKFIKRAESISNEAHLPSIKELRYGARRYFQALEERQQGAPDEVLRTHLIEAIENCRKARHDAVDASISFLHGEIDVLVRKAGIDTVASVFPGFVDLKDEMNHVSDIIVKTREERAQLDDGYDQIVEQHLDKIVALHRKLEIARPIVVAVLKRRRLAFVVNTLIVGAALGLIFNLARVYADRHGWFDFMGGRDSLPSRTSTTPK